VLADAQADAHLFEVQRFGFGAAFLGLFGALVVVFAPIYDFGHRRVGIGRNFYEVHFGLAGGGQGLIAAQNTQLAVVFADNTQLRGSYALVPARILSDVLTP